MMATKSDRPKWGRFCGVCGHDHSNFKQFEECPVCYALNPTFENIVKRENSITSAIPAVVSEDQSIITIDDSEDSSQKLPSAIMTDIKMNPQPLFKTSTPSAFASFDKAANNARIAKSKKGTPDSQLISQRQASFASKPSGAITRIKAGDTMTATVRLVICYYKMIILEDLEYREFVNDPKTVGELFNYYFYFILIYYIDKRHLEIPYCQIINLDDFIHTHLLREVDTWKAMAETSVNEIYLATEVAKDGPTGLPKSANEIHTTAELLYKFFRKGVTAKAFTIFLVLGKQAKPEPENEVDTFEDIVFRGKKRQKVSRKDCTSDVDSESSTKPIKSETKKRKTLKPTKTKSRETTQSKTAYKNIKKEKSQTPKSLLSHGQTSLSNESIDSGDDLFPPDTALSAEEKVESLQDFKYEEDIDEKDNILEDNESVSDPKKVI